MRIIAIDPGAGNTGVVYMDEHRVLCAKTFTHKGACGVDNDLLRERCNSIWYALRAWLADKPHDVVVVEGFVPFNSGKNFYSNAHQTPWLVGSLVARLDDDGENIAIQTSRQVLNPRSRGNKRDIFDALAMKKKPYPGCECVTNEHTRSALCHGLYYLDSVVAND